MKYEYKDTAKEAERDLSDLAVQIADRINLKFPRKSIPIEQTGNGAPEFRRNY